MSEQTTRITKVGTVILPVSDQDRALDLFVGTFGFEKRLDGEFAPGQRWIEVAPPGAETSIALVPQDASEGVEISFATDDAEADHAAMLEAGIRADAELIDLGQGVPPMFTFRDPDGNCFRVVERG
ncbi:MAG TPA: VOC family protein [Actinomycetota bacterium]|jgi:catechol 2,3-dioxygenase-like lactoylglutathione lyase family enzyme|nr:VOC family protein [Actinomycetota bacterium]